MKNIGWGAAAVLFAALLTACATPTAKVPTAESTAIEAEMHKQEDLALRRVLDHRAQLYTASYKILRTNADLCAPKDRFSLGAHFLLEEDVPKDERAVWKRHLAIDGTPVVEAVAPDSPAALAGLAVGDKIVKLNGQATPSDPDDWQKLVTQALKSDAPVTLEVARAGATLPVTITPTKVCGFDIAYLENSDVNAYADGDTIYITRGMIDFAESEQELAFVVGHELAHNHMKHIDAQQQNSYVAGAGGLILDVLFAAAGVNTGGAFTDAAMRAGGAAYSVEFEQEADYIGMYFTERAGYDTAGVADLWRRMAIDNRDAIKHRSSHPTSPERFLAIEKAREEIEAKKLAGEPMAPNIKEE